MNLSLLPGIYHGRPWRRGFIVHSRGIDFFCLLAGLGEATGETGAATGDGAGSGEGGGAGAEALALIF